MAWTGRGGIEEIRNMAVSAVTKWSLGPLGNDPFTGNGSTARRLQFIEGTFLVNGRPLGKLPEEYNKDEFFRHVFGDRA